MAKRQPMRALPTVSHENAQKCHLLRLPLEMLAEILSYTRPPELLSLARTSKYFCRVLCNPGSSFMWKQARIDPDVLFVIPDPPPNMPEPAYAAMIFDSGKCYICQGYSGKMFRSYAYRARLCSRRACTRQWRRNLYAGFGYGAVGFSGGKFTTIADQTEFLKTVFEETDESLLHTLALCASVHLDPLESPKHEPSSPNAIYVMEQLQSAIRAFAKKYIQAKGNPQAVEALLSTYAVQKEIQNHRYQQFLRLRSWTKKYEELKEQTNADILQYFQSFATEHCLRMCDMEKGATFLRVRKMCRRLFDGPILELIEPHVERIIEETCAIVETRERREQKRRLCARREDIENYYKKYDALILPTLQDFRNLPILRALECNDAAESLQQDLQSNAIATSVHDQLEQWVKSAKDDLMKLFGYGKGEGLRAYRPQANEVHPLERPTALFQCKECNRVGSSHGRMGVLDFKGLCLHECIQPAKSKADRTKWSASNFELASGAIATARAALDALVWDEDTSRLTDLRGEWFYCKICAQGICEMMFEDLLRHCQRHTTQFVTYAGDHDHQPQYEESASRRCSVAELKSGKHNREVVRYQFACAHCRFRNTQIVAGAEATWVEVENPERMDFNSLLSHLAVRHQIHDVWNEDYYWLPWDESMEPAKKEEQEPRITQSPPMAQELEPIGEDVVPDAAYQLRKRRAGVKRYFCKHCPEGSISSATAIARRGFDWRVLTAHMKSKHSIDKPANTIDYEMRNQDRSPSGMLRPIRRCI